MSYRDSAREIIAGHFRLWLAVAAGAILILGFIEQCSSPWKRVQLDYFERLESTLEQQLAAQVAASKDALTLAEGELRVALDGLRTQREEIATLKSETFALGLRLKEAEARLEHANDLEASRQARAEVEGLREWVTVRQGKLADLLNELSTAEARLAETHRPAQELRDRLDTLRRDAWLRALPGLRWWAPSLKVRSDPQHSDPQRCVTCHLGMDPELGAFDIGDTSEEPVLAPHPGDELYGPSALRAHQDLSCTDCHGGDGRSTDFRRAGHPAVRAGAQNAISIHRNPSHRNPSHRDPILSGKLIQATCVRCHARDEPALATVGSGSQEQTVPAIDRASLESPVIVAPDARAGRQWVDRLGCRACHLTGGDTLPREGTKPGPPLHSIADKLTPSWTSSFLSDPRTWHPESAMPSLWPARRPPDLAQPQSHQPESPLEIQAVEIQAVIAYLWQYSRPSELLEASSGWSRALSDIANAARGRAHFDSLGCAQCHSRSAQSALNPELRMGPPLARLGKKVTAPWLFRWLKKPHAWRADTLMPDFRLLDSEAADLTAFLLGLAPDSATTASNPETLNVPADAQIDPSLRDRLILNILENQGTLEAAQARFETMAPKEKLLFLGRQTILRLGCHGCHDIPGFETTEPPDGGDLRDVGRELRFELQSATATDIDPLAAHPEYWDLSQRATDSLRVQMLAWRQREPRFITETGSIAESDTPIEPGLLIMRRRGCFACHLNDGEPLIDAPALNGIGAKLKTAYLHAYLSDPESQPPVRPWLERRMPSFHFSSDELDVLIRFLVDREDVPMFDRRPALSPAELRLELTVGRAAFEALQCGRCHWQDPDAGLHSTAPAPSYFSSSDRLRPQWLESWILNPEQYDPGTVMPSPMPVDGQGAHDTSALEAALGVPLFELQRIRIAQLFTSEAEQNTYLNDADNIARALGHYLQRP